MENQPLDWKKIVTEHYLKTEAEYAQRRAVDLAEDLKRKRERLLSELRSVIGKAADLAEISEDGQKATLDGVEFGLRTVEYSTYLYILGVCPHCGKVAASVNINNAYDLGEALVNFRPNWNHEHRYGPEVTEDDEDTQPAATPEPPAPTLAEQLETLIRAIVRDEVSQREDF
jgi:hypothetical protein